MELEPDLPDSVDTRVFADPIQGVVRWSATKSLWWLAMTLIWISLAATNTSISSVIVFLILTATTLCFGHSLGMHRKLIHKAFDCPLWLERVFVYLSTLVGLGGPFTMMHTHDTRDWAQRLPQCHSFLSHQNGIVKDFYWQLHCKLHLEFPPRLQYPVSVQQDRFYRFLQATSILQQLFTACLLYLLGGWAWVIWGVCARVSVSVFGHWLIGYFAHNGRSNSKRQSWHLDNVAVQGYNVNGLGLLTFGECWHNNHHAYPGSAKLGLERNQMDPGWYMLKVLEHLNLAWNIKTPENLPRRSNLVKIDLQDVDYRASGSSSTPVKEI